MKMGFQEGCKAYSRIDWTGCVESIPRVKFRPFEVSQR